MDLIYSVVVLAAVVMEDHSDERSSGPDKQEKAATQNLQNAVNDYQQQVSQMARG
jgi:hypothetical protein